MRGLAPFALAVMVAGCSRGFESEKLGMSWTPPSGISLVAEEPGPPPRAEFGSGVIWYRLDGVAVSFDEAKLAEGLEVAATVARAPLDGTLVSSRIGSLPTGDVIRYEVHGTGYRALAYLIPREKGALLVIARAPDARFGLVSASVERSLSTLRLR